MPSDFSCSKSFISCSAIRARWSNNQTLEDITHLQKIFTKNPNLFVSDFQGLIGEDGQLHIMDPQGVNLHSDIHFLNQHLD
jgi:hypothetical protein